MIETDYNKIISFIEDFNKNYTKNSLYIKKLKIIYSNLITYNENKDFIQAPYYKNCSNFHNPLIFDNYSFISFINNIF